MKIEKINDRQIRCTLTKEDLASREIKLSANLLTVLIKPRRCFRI